MNRPATLIVVLACFTISNAAMPAKGATRKAILERLCPEAIRAEKLRHDANEGRAVTDAAAYNIYKQAARLFYRCSQAVPDPEIRDVALYEYATSLFLSTRTNRDVLDAGPVLDAKLNDLAYRTKFQDLRKNARDLRREVRSAYREAYKVVHEVYPEDAPELGPATKPTPEIPESVGPTIEITPRPCFNCPQS